MPKNFNIEKAGPDDLPHILEVMRPWNMHHFPSEEMEELDINNFFVAKVKGNIVGASGYKLLSQTLGKTTLLAVLPEYSKWGIGKALQDIRLQHMHQVGVKKVITNSDRPRVISWYMRRYRYKKVGTLKKLCSYGDPDIDHWTTLEMNLEAHMRRVNRQTIEAEFIARHEPHPLAPFPPLIINVCLSGAVPTKDITEFVPISEEEIIKNAISVYDAGARIVHIHAFDKKGAPTWKADVYERIIKGIRKERSDLLCCVSCSGRHWQEFEKRSEVLHLSGSAKPDLASLSLGSLNFANGPSINSVDMIIQLTETMKKKKILPELEVFDLGMISFAVYLERKGYLSGRKYFNFMLGSLGQIPATIGNLSTMIKSLPENSIWSAAGLGNFQLPMNVAALVAGGGIRVGIEDNYYFDFERKKLASNLDLVNRIVRLANELERQVATPAEARQMLGL
jgi:3-keto-5-aminohexanoate cleavage enzyme